MKKFNLSESIKRGLPVLVWSRKYGIEVAIADFVAGLTIGLTLIPQCIAYASLAGLGPEYGLYSSLFGGLIYCIFGTVPELNIAPTAIMSLLTFTFTHDVTYGNVKAAILLCFLSGVIELLCGFLHLGFLVDFVSTPVVAAFTSAGALTVASSQLKNLLGLNFPAGNFVKLWISVAKHISEVKKWDALLGIGCCIVLLSIRKLKDVGAPPTSTAQAPPTWKKLLWFCSVGRNAFVVLTSSIAAYFLHRDGHAPFSLTSDVPQGLPGLVLPFAGGEGRNGTMGLVRMTRELGVGVIVMPFIAILENVAISKSFAKGRMIDASQEMIAVGMCNVIGSFFGAYPITASFSRAAVSNASGVRTPFSGIYTGLMVLTALTFLTPYFSYIPKPTLAAVIICAIIFMVEVTLPKIIWQINKIDLVPYFITLVGCLTLEIEIGIIIGVCVDIIFVLYMTARPKLEIEKVTTNGISYLKATPTTAILYPAAEYIREKILQSQDTKHIIIDCQKINKLDFTAAKSFEALASDLTTNNKIMIFYKAEGSVAKILERIKEGNFQQAATEADLHNFLLGARPGATFEIDMEQLNKNCCTQL